METIICYIISYLLEGFILWHYCFNMFQSKYTHSKEFFSVFLLYLCLLLPGSQENMFLNMISFFLVNFIYIFLLFETKWYSALFHAAVTASIMGLSEIFIIGIISDLAYDFYNKDTLFQRISILLPFSKLLYFVVLQIIIQLFGKFKENLVRTSAGKGTYFLICIPLITFWIIITLASFCITTQLNPFMEGMVAVSALLLLIINLLVFSIYRYNQQKEAEAVELQLQLQKEFDSVEYYKMLLQEHENQSILIHDIKKHLQSLSMLNEQNERDKIANYIECIIHSSALQNSVRVCDHELLNAILCRYQHNCHEKSVSFRTDIRSGCVDFMSDNDLTVLFCNLLDNGLEAASLLPDSFIELNVGRKSGTSLIVLTMINSCRVNPFSPSGRLITTKQNRKMHGFGLKSIKRIVEKYHGEMKLYYEEESHTFHTIIIFTL